MHPFQLKTERPTLKAAHAFFKEGLSSANYVSREGREAEIKNALQEIFSIVTRQFPRTQNLEYAILKSHLIVEHALVQYIRCFSAVSSEVKDIRFTFSQKLEVAYLMGFGADNPTLLPTVELLNKIRNQVAHTFTLDRVAVDELLRINSENKYHGFKLKNDRQRVQHLGRVCSFICAAISAHIIGAYAATFRPDSDEQSSEAALRAMGRLLDRPDIPAEVFDNK